jgi:Zn-dependent peptidase ImmA (M78 family)
MGTSFILQNSVDDGSLVPVIHVLEPLFKEKHRQRLEFILAHEIAHIVNGDILVNHIPGTPVYRDNERRADASAISLLGTNEGGLAYLTHMHACLTDPEKVAQLGTLQEDLTLAIEQIKERIEWMK